MSTIKLSSPATHEFWEIPVLFEDADLLVLDKPAGLQISQDKDNPERPALMALLHEAIASRKPWTEERHLNYLTNAHRLDAETSGILILAKSKPALVALADFFGTQTSGVKQLTLVHGAPREDRFEVNAKLAPHPMKPELMHVDPKDGKKSQTKFEVVERFGNFTLMRCLPLTPRRHQVRVHLQNSGLRIVGDELYGGKPLLLSRLKKDYRLKPDRVERPLISRVILHGEEVELPHPMTGDPLKLSSPLPKDLRVALKYLKQYAN